MKNFKKCILFIGILGVLLAMPACDSDDKKNEHTEVKPEQTSEPDQKENSEADKDKKEDKKEETNSKNSEQEIAKKSLTKGLWRPSDAEKQDKDGMLESVPLREIYGTAFAQFTDMGLTFKDDGTFENSTGVYSSEDHIDKGTYTIDTKNKVITFKVKSGDHAGETMKIEYDHKNNGEVMYFVFPASSDTQGCNIRYDLAKK